MAKDTTKTRTDDLRASTSTSTGQLPTTAVVPPVGPAADGGTLPADSAAMKVTTETATRPGIETVQTSTTPSGEPRSAAIEPQMPRPAAFRSRAAGSVFDPAFPASGRSTYAGTLPARERVLAGGERIAITAVAPDTETREFTATIRILKSKVLYEPGALVPLTRRDFEAKRSRSSVLERSFEDGLEASAD
ncbi:hypothetical protein [Aurantimonas sp. 22II-16-19i]|uniref:hypothetical protein n=1 Tax=Aurantimonas sp. 22II-16-19i TaxID=1317114 RepID=UPI0009F7A579|nr:hypothetical protein [Aurantimonas sp. 22II-16-19i]ORE85734.1 hypothetical protein ATO4_26222 [Aurantimonas sp. 22II-16-19i]